MNWHKVTDDPDLHAELLEKEQEVGTPALVEYVHERGLYPPGWPDVDAGISVAWEPDDPPESEGTLVWDVEANPEQV